MTELERRLDLLEAPENQGQPLDRTGFSLLAVLTLVLPVMMLLVGQVLPG
ncbi:hypothetical protein LVY72_14300 [Arthrobacter sp. I2-34]|uniref:Uncharacterized protein n=1 Tax=Arthrobacter hankyongi TaxID=2904801 RepID=A0ABS9L8R7_9MICC|nr:hypothetical protein [Arthrobacter hankyongi]MCG2623071.1 hypothetical protein [Arthrobacter hankyongi]